jgi:hypothetical protein
MLYSKVYVVYLSDSNQSASNPCFIFSCPGFEDYVNKSMMDGLQLSEKTVANVLELFFIFYS